MNIDQTKLDDLMGRVIDDMAAAWSNTLVEPAAGDRLADNLHPFRSAALRRRRAFCEPNAVGRGGSGLGAQAGEANLRGGLRAGRPGRGDRRRPVGPHRAGG